MNNRRERIRELLKDKKNTREITNILITEGFQVGQAHIWEKMKKETKFNKMNGTVRSEVSKLKKDKIKEIQSDKKSVKRNLLYQYLNGLEITAGTYYSRILDITKKIRDLLDKKQIFLPEDILLGIQSLFTCLVVVIELTYNPDAVKYAKTNKIDEIEIEIEFLHDDLKNHGIYLQMDVISSEPNEIYSLIGKYELKIHEDRVKLTEISQKNQIPLINDFYNEKTRFELYYEILNFIETNYILSGLRIGFWGFKVFDEVHHSRIFNYVMNKLNEIKFQELIIEEEKKWEKNVLRKKRLKHLQNEFNSMKISLTPYDFDHNLISIHWYENREGIWDLPDSNTHKPSPHLIKQYDLDNQNDFFGHQGLFNR